MTAKAKRPPPPPERPIVERRCNRCNARTEGVCTRCGCPEYRLERDKQARLF